MQAEVKTLSAEAAGEIELDDDIFALEPRRDLIHRMVRYQLARRQSGTHYAKTRSDVVGSGKKIGNQKGGGRARHGNKKVPQFRGGGKAFGPQPRSHAHDLPKKVRKLALKHALSDKAKSEQLLIIDDARMGEVKTSLLKSRLSALGIESALVVTGAAVDANLEKSAWNIPNLDVLPVQGINVYDIMRRDKLVLTKAALEGLEARLK